MLLDRQRGAGILVDGEQYGRLEGETPLSFINRVRDDHNAWKASQEAEKTREERDRQDRRREATDRYNSPEFKPKSLVQTVEESLAATIEAKVNELATSCDQLQKEYDRASHIATCQWERLRRTQKELSHARRLLKELEQYDDSESEVSKEMGRDLSEQVGQGEPPGGDRVVEENGAVVRSTGSTEIDPGD